MKKHVKILLYLCIFGFVGIAVTGAMLMGTGKLMSYEAAKEYPVSQPFQKIELHTVKAQVTFAPADTGFKVVSYAKAWLPGPVDMDSVLDVTVQNGVLIVTEKPFPKTFLGLFPQPYEMILTLHAPQAAWDSKENGL